MSLADLIQLPIQSIDYLHSKLEKLYHFIRPIKMKQPLMTTEQYNTIYPFVAHALYQELAFTPYDTTLVHLEEDENMEFFTDTGIELNGFYIAEHRTAKVHTFVFTYEGTWLYNGEPLNAPNYIRKFIDMMVCNSYECLIYNKLLTKENLFMDNIERLQMEISGIELPHEELLVYLEEEGLDGYKPYNASSKVNKKAIYQSALSVLNSIANQPHAMKNYKQDDMTVEGFAKYLQARIDQLEKKIRQMPNEDSTNSNFFNLFQ
ncbi:glutathionylspermidine synthase [Bacillus subtilis]|uniref:glutathionylspermidine synthase n=1 Tax=Bacillus subtilis TaxID=1423 RepID=UPI0013BC199A|nr:glutathionylspermidine synthase [Bacillus subtilis]KAF2425593.1 glutathionylspermidine synthase [Bacillus subtilis]